MKKFCLNCNLKFNADWQKRKFCSKSCVYRFMKGKLPKNFKDFRDKGSLACVGRKPWNKNLKGIHLHSSTEFKKGNHYSQKTEFVKGSTAKENHWNWKGGITPKNKQLRIKFKREFAPLIFERDNYTCQMCKKRGVELHADHIKSWVDYPRLRFNLDNCRTLCKECHYFITWGKYPQKNTRFGSWR